LQTYSKRSNHHTTLPPIHHKLTSLTNISREARPALHLQEKARS